MPAPTPGFVGARLREARQVRGLRGVELAEILDVTPQAISSYETGRKSPTPAIATAIATKLNLPLDFFMRKTDELRDPVFYRSMSAATKSARSRAEGRLRWLESIAEYLGSAVDFPRINLPDFDLPVSPLDLGDDDIENIACDVRRYWQMNTDSPIGNMVYLLENQGVIVARDRLGAVTLDSLSSVSGSSGRPYVMIGTDKGTAVRWRFDAAHELGHLVLHSKVNPKTFANPGDFKRMEDQAHRFGAAFLLPMASFADDFFSASLDILRAMKPKWRVSIAMMIKRAHDCQLISDDHYTQMYRNYSRRRWNSNEPFDDTLDAEEPHLMRQAVEMTLTQGSQSRDDIAAAIALSSGDIENLCSLPPGYLRAGDQPLVTIRRETGDATVYKFHRRK
jgi:Zn-dependent peptidase ImmA (M78 family)/DNA-binding XRE family transcriptional regulator